MLLEAVGERWGQEKGQWAVKLYDRLMKNEQATNGQDKRGVTARVEELCYLGV